MQPGTPAPRHVALLVDYTNSIDHEEGTDDLLTPDGLAAWLRAHDLAPGSRRPTADELALARRLREALRAELVQHHDEALDRAPSTSAAPESGSGLDTVAAELPLRLRVVHGRAVLAPVEGGVLGSLSRVLAAVNDASADGTWARLKICAADTCAWAYVDTTKNRSRRWCEWGCGNKIKTRAYRARRRASERAAASPGPA